MLAAIVPAHDEEDHLQACLQSLRTAAESARLDGEPVEVIVVLDRCSDGSEAIARRFATHVIPCDARNVGVARALGAQRALALGARWLSFTDADTLVDPEWFATQLALQSDAVCGTVAVKDWSIYGESVRRQYEAAYKDEDGHRHIHGANLGVSAAAYVAAGGFEPLVSSEDVALVDALQRSGAKIAWSAAPRVFTSARRCFRAPSGFGAHLMKIATQAAWTPPGLAA
jgi:glycosyltransferase involved in cell wall biosynthesis